MTGKGFENIALRCQLLREIEKIAQSKGVGRMDVINQVLGEYVDKWRGVLF